MDSAIWDFKVALDFSKAFESDPQSGNKDRSALQPPSQTEYVPSGLGDFSRVWKALGLDAPSVSIQTVFPRNIEDSNTCTAPNSDIRTYRGHTISAILLLVLIRTSRRF